LIPTWNNLSFLKLCVRSIQKNSAFPHQLIIHVNEGTDGSLNWVKENGYSFTYSKTNIGVCWALNSMRSLVDTEYIVFMNDDMYACPGWDLELLKEIESLPNNMFFLSSTLIQPFKFWCRDILAPANFGTEPSNFNEAELLKTFRDLQHGDWHGSTWPPNIVHRDIWDLVGGYSVEFSPGMYSDPDFSAKLYMAGIRYFKGVDKSRVYHFVARSTGRVKRNKGTKQFLYKWGITSGIFMKYLLHRGTPFGKVQKKEFLFKIARFRSKLKIVFTSPFSAGNSRNLGDF